MDHEQAAPLVSDWVRGRLDAARSAAVERHAGGCAECRAAAEGARALEAESGRLAAGAGEHPSSDLLARYVSLPRAESIADLARIGAHLRACAACREDAALMREAAAPGAWRAARAWLESFPPLPRALQPALALAVVLLAIPAWLGLVVAPRERAQFERRLSEEAGSRAPAPAPPPAGGGVAALVLGGATRSSEAAPSLRLRAGQALQPVLLDVVPPAGKLTARVVRADGTLAWTATGAREEFWDETNRLVGLLVPAAALPPGDYRLELATGAGGPPFFEARFAVTPAR